MILETERLYLREMTQEDFPALCLMLQDAEVMTAYEHVFDGVAESAVNGFNLEVPSLEGDTAIMELGVTMKPSQNSPWSMDLGAKGYAGDREGVTGNVVVRYAF